MLICEYCDREVPADVDQSDLPYPQHVSCSDVCSILIRHRKVEVDA